MKIWMRLHKWVGLVIGLQVLLWIAGGLYMSAVPLPWVHGKPLLTDAAPPAPPESLLMRSAARQNNVELNLSKYRTIRWLHAPQGWLLLTTGFDDATHFWQVDRDGLRLAESPSEQELQQLALSRYAGNGKIISIEHLPIAPTEASGIDHAVVAIQFDDWINTTFYLHPISAEILKVRSDIWRLFDVFWMLHIMDYESRSDFNNPLLIVSAFIALFFTLTGMVLVLYWLRREIRRNRT